ncbi:site-2 protease family protein [Tateyamaria omphalii]|uniref:site-2 protease family protein n=1 Tax=Tateyamaria omphalii TaxID=299262 RepID=UPI001C997338|nr:site-2 protease family protein [Tateyamaria omphalii]MBY5931929.1 site-2 protease family protein [Tateyamaria omphalii]
MFAHARTIVTVFGFNIRIDPSWVLIAGLITWSLAQHSFPAALPDLSQWTYAILAISGACLFFASLVGHELAHALTARRFGIDTRSITLFLFGGVAELTREPDKAMHEFWIALAGPAMSLALAFVFALCAEVAVFAVGVGPMTALFHYLALVNVVLAVFNLLPAFPLDGGRILRAWLWWRRGDMLEATEAAARTGAVLAYALMALGLVGLFQGATVAGFWQILIGLFILSAAKSAVDAQRTRALLGNRHVHSVMSSPPVTVSAETTLAALVNQVMLTQRVSFVPVVEHGRVLGHIDTDVLRGIDRENWASTRVGDVFVEMNQTVCVPPDMPVLRLFERISETGQRKFMVVQDGQLEGVISLSDLTRQLGLLTDLGKHQPYTSELQS